MIEFLIYSIFFIAWFTAIAIFLFVPRTVIGKLARSLARYGLYLAVLESLCVTALYINTGKWVFLTYPERIRSLYQKDPYLVGTPKPGAKITRWDAELSHNKDGFRGKEISPKSGRTRIAALGGSTTYGVGVGDEDTWPFYLEKALGPDYEVINFGMPAHTTVEHIIFSALHLPRYEPEFAIIHAGLNDLHVMHAPGLRDDYSPFHAAAMHGNLYLCHEDSLPQLGMIRMAVLILQKLNFYPACSYYQIDRTKIPKSEIDESALRLYRRNLKTLITILKRFGIKPLLLPQVINAEALAEIDYRWWTPYITQESLPEHLQRYNEVMRSIALEEGVPYLVSVLEEKWTRTDFVDSSHFNNAGNERFARSIASPILHAIQALKK
jgi:lysophospholipase L1-like esterase